MPVAALNIFEILAGKFANNICIASRSKPKSRIIILMRCKLVNWTVLGF